MARRNKKKKKKKKSLPYAAVSTVVHGVVYTMEICVSDIRNCALVVSADVIFPRSASVATRLKTFVRYAFFFVSNVIYVSKTFSPN